MTEVGRRCSVIRHQLRDGIDLWLSKSSTDVESTSGNTGGGPAENEESNGSEQWEIVGGAEISDVSEGTAAAGGVRSDEISYGLDGRSEEGPSPLAERSPPGGRPIAVQKISTLSRESDPEKAAHIDQLLRLYGLAREIAGRHVL